MKIHEDKEFVLPTARDQKTEGKDMIQMGEII